MSYIIEGIDRLGKDTLVRGILSNMGYHVVLHRSKPPILETYKDMETLLGKTAQYWYQYECFDTDMALLTYAEQNRPSFIFNRSWLGEAVYAPLYRGYSGDYVFDLEKSRQVNLLNRTKLILLTEDFTRSNHFVDDGDSFDNTKRETEQGMFIAALEKSTLKHKKVVCVTDGSTGKFRSAADILLEVLG